MAVFTAGLGAIAILATAQPAEPEAEAADPCRFGAHGPAADITLETAPPDYPGFTDEVPPLTVRDPCGLRFTDLSGVWSADGVQYIAYHDLRTGEIVFRFMHVPYNEPLFSTWGFRFADPSAFGVIAPDASRIEMYSHLRFPNRLRDICPDDAEPIYRSHHVQLDYDDQGRPRLTRTRMHSYLRVAPCRIDHERFVESRYTRTPVGGAP